MPTIWNQSVLHRPNGRHIRAVTWWHWVAIPPSTGRGNRGTCTTPRARITQAMKVRFGCGPWHSPFLPCTGMLQTRRHIFARPAPTETRPERDPLATQPAVHAATATATAGAEPPSQQAHAAIRSDAPCRRLRPSGPVGPGWRSARLTSLVASTASAANTHRLHFSEACYSTGRRGLKGIVRQPRLEWCKDSCQSLSPSPAPSSSLRHGVRSWLGTADDAPPGA